MDPLSRLASAVSVPDPEPASSSPPESNLKRRKPSITDPDTKRRRLSSHSNYSNREKVRESPDLGSIPDFRRRSSTGAAKPVSPGKEGGQKDDREPSSATTTTTSRKVGRRDEERKRGQRLFGGLLGTLSQGSNSTAQRRRADIERRQQDKLKLQDEEYDGLKKKRRDERVAIRKKEQRIYGEESV